jgi:hypothetical protein
LLNNYLFYALIETKTNRLLGPIRALLAQILVRMNEVIFNRKEWRSGRTNFAALYVRSGAGRANGIPFTPIMQHLYFINKYI